MASVRHYLGLDIGSVAAKAVLIDEEGCIVHTGVEKVTADSRAAVNALLSRLKGTIELAGIAAAGVSGTGKTVVPRDFGWAEYSSSLAIGAGVVHHHPDVRTIIQIGGQSSLVIVLEDGLRKPWKVVANPLCAAGTGRFIEQQAYRLGIPLDEFADIALQCRDGAPRIAARCSVFAKSDLIHLQQKGVPVAAMLYALCESIARMVVSMRKGALPEPVYFVGGVAGNRAVVKALANAISERNGHETTVTVPEYYAHAEALGAALLSRGKTSNVCLLPETRDDNRYFEMPPLKAVSIPPAGMNGGIRQICDGYLGVDIGSTSTKAVIMDASGTRMLAKSYLMTAGRPVDAVRDVFRNLLKDGAENVRIAGVGVTGSGRYLIGSLIGADLVKNEITAQTRAAAEIDPDADIIEIGGQDSKLVIKRNGVVVDYQMNKACAAGTGSFIDELAEMLNVSVRDGEFARLAFAAPHAIDLGTRCAAFIGQAVPAALGDGVSLEVIAASLAVSIARNYLSKVVGSRRLGRKVILTGAVFYNQAIAAAFQQELDGRELVVAEHREVSGAIGAALLAREGMRGKGSRFKGFEAVINADCALSTFVCKACEDNCTITRMQTVAEKPTFYGSRCDRYDGTLRGETCETAFDRREELLLREYGAERGDGLKVGIPRALLVHDLAPLLIGFLNALGVKVALSGRTSKDIMERAVELSYTDSCFPVKLLNGHAAALKNVDYMLYPSVLRLGEAEGDANQKYACPLVQSAPYIVRQTLDLGPKLLAPVVDFSHGETEVIASLADAAAEMGFSRVRGRRAALGGLEAQRRFEADTAAAGEKLLADLKESGKLGVVLLSRSYMSQDPGANLGIAGKLAQLGVVPIPLDFLPLHTIDPGKYSDRPYWSYEGKLIAAAAIVAATPQLYGLALTNFGCGPNSFTLPLLEDIMGGKPMGQLELDEHAAEAGLVTRLEAFVDTIEGFARSVGARVPATRDIYRGVSPEISAHKTLVLPRMAPHADALAAAMEACGVHAVSLPEPDERNLLHSNQVTSGTECLPYRVTLGDFMRYFRENGHDRNVEGFMAGSYGPCRLGKYAIEQRVALKNLGIDLNIRTTVSNNAYRDLGLGPAFERLAWKAIVAVDCLHRLLWRARPYETRRGAADRLFDESLAEIVTATRVKGDLRDILRRAAHAFRGLIDPGLPRRPLVGINGEIYLRSNRFSNKDLVRVCEDAGLEAVVSPIGEWIKYTSYRNVEDALRQRQAKKAAVSLVKKFVQERDEAVLHACCDGLGGGPEPSTAEILEKSSQFLSSRCGSEAVLSIGSGLDWMEDERYAGVISVMPHGCMPGGIVAAMAEKLGDAHDKPWISLTYDGFPESTNQSRITEFAELVRFCRNGLSHA